MEAPRAYAVSCGPQHSVAIKEDGTMVQWGNITFDQRDGFPEGIKVNAVSCGTYHSVAIKEDGTMVQWGGAKINQRDGFPEGIKVNAVSCGTYHSVAIKEDGTMVQWGDVSDDQRDGFPEGIKVNAVSCGPYRNVAIKEDGTMVQWGNVTFDQRDGFPEGIKVNAVSCGSYHSVAIKEDGTMVQWGNARDDQRDGFPDGIKVNAVSCGLYHSVAIKEDGTMVQWGNAAFNQRDGFPEVIKVNAVSCGSYHSVAIKEDRTLVQWGKLPPGTWDDEESYDDPIGGISERTPEALDPNPFPKYALKLQVNKLPKKNMDYTPQTTAFDPVMQSDVTIDEALADPEKPLIVKVKNIYSLIDRNFLEEGVLDGSLIRYGCTKQLGLAVYPANVYGRNPFVYLKGLQSGNFLVLHDELDRVLTVDSGVKAIELTETGDVFPTITAMHSIIKNGSKNFFGQDIDLVGADHCQAGSQQKVYAITILDLKKVGGRKRRKTRRLKKKLRKTKKRRN